MDIYVWKQKRFIKKLQKAFDDRLFSRMVVTHQKDGIKYREWYFMPDIKISTEADELEFTIE